MVSTLKTGSPGASAAISFCTGAIVASGAWVVRTCSVSDGNVVL